MINICVVGLQIENQAYPVNVDALHTVFNPYGFVQKIACFEKNNTWQVGFVSSNPLCNFGLPLGIFVHWQDLLESPLQ